MSELKAETIVPQGSTVTLQMYPKAEADKVIAHHKYKRCLDKAKQCTSMMIFNSKYGTDKKWHLFKKWRDRWLALAEKFKEAKL